MSLLDRLFRHPRRERTVAELYGLIVAQARRPWFYLEGGVPDTVEGRFELIALHAWLVMRRLKDLGPAENAFNQALFDYMFKDMDRSLRELGAGDLGVGEKVKEMARHFYGRVAAYEGALMPGRPPEALAEALDRNLYGSTLPEPAQVARMAAHVRAESERLAGFPVSRLMAGEVAFAEPPAALARVEE
ncbi:MAG TPA: ubiquinol-cytochrome C chaperone family protein [Azospirillaceae bacterium]|nr:ubiquinol-cytochrome C chaperone family protein [Azospirillaceae bacterium]